MANKVKKIKNITLIIASIIIATITRYNLQAEEMPYWIRHIPQPKSGNFYYRITYAEGKNYQEAYSKAFAMAILESTWKLGVEVNQNQTLENLSYNISQNIEFLPKGAKIHINKVCEYKKKSTGSMKIEIYILWQVGNNSQNPQFENFSNCE